MKGAGGVAFLGASAAVLPLFSTPDLHQNPAKCTTADTSATDKRLVVSNWPAYVDSPGYYGKDAPSTIELFEQKFGVSVDYTADVNDNVEFFGKIKNLLGYCAPTGRDMMMLTDWMAARLIQLGWIQPLDADAVPNVHSNIISSLKAPDWDPERKYSAPWQSGFTGIGYNSKYLAPPGTTGSDLPPAPTTINELLTRPDLNGKVAVLTEMRDTMGLIMLGNGMDPAKFTPADWTKAIGILKDAKDSGQIRAFEGNEYLNDLSAGNIYAAMVWSGDMAASGDPHMRYLVPEEGQMIWADNMLIPNMSPHRTLAEEWINFYYQPEIAARLCDYNYYISPVQGVQSYLEKLDPSLFKAKNKDLLNLILPDDDYLKQTHLFMALDEVQIRKYEGDFSDVSGV